MSFTTFILDVDGVLSTGQFSYTDSAPTKATKTFGPDDNDALRLLSAYISDIQFVSADHRGFPITQKRLADMDFPLTLLSTEARLSYIQETYDPNTVIYMGDGFYDGLIFDVVGYGIAPRNALQHTQEKADFVTQHRGGESAVAEAALHIMTTILGLKHPDIFPKFGVASHALPLKVLTEHYAEAFSQKDLTRVLSFFADDIVLEDPTIKHLSGKASVKLYIQDIFSHAPELSLKIDCIRQEQSTTILQFSLTLDGNSWLKGVDIIVWEAQKISSIQAYIYDA